MIPAVFKQHALWLNNAKTGKRATFPAGCDLSNQHFANVDLTWACFPNLIFTNTRFDQVNLVGAALAGCNFERANLSGCDLQGADLSGCNLRRANLSACNFEGACLENCDLDLADLEGAQLKGANLTHTSFVRASLKYANATKVDLSSANLYQAIIDGMSLDPEWIGGPGHILFALTEVEAQTIVIARMQQEYNISNTIRHHKDKKMCGIEITKLVTEAISAPPPEGTWLCCVEPGMTNGHRYKVGEIAIATGRKHEVRFKGGMESQVCLWRWRTVSIEAMCKKCESKA